MVCISPGFAQKKGTVVDCHTFEPIQNAHVIADNESKITDEKGVFYLQTETTQIIVSHVGYLTDTLKSNALQNNIKILLKPAAIPFDPITIRGNFNDYPLMKMPSSAGNIPDLSIPDINQITYVENLNLVPGVFVHSGTPNTNRITIRGVGSRNPYGTNRIKAYYNEIPLTTGDGNTELEDLDASTIGSVDILKGSKSALYGAGLGGVVMLNKPEYIAGTNSYAKFSLASYNTMNAKIGIKHKQNGFYIMGNLSHVQTEGWRQNSEYNRTNFTSNTGYVNNKNEVDLIFLFIKTKAHIPSSLSYQTFTHAPDSAAQSWLAVKGYETYSKLIAGISFKHSFSDNIYNKTSLFAQTYEGYESRPFNILDDKAGKLGFRNITSLIWNHAKIQAGIEFMFENYHWQIYETKGGEQGVLDGKYSVNRQPVSIFLNGQYQFFKRLILEAGLSVNALSYKLMDEFVDDIDLSNNFRYDWIISPFLGANLAINQSWYIYSSVSHGFSAPSVEETLMPEGLINPDLKQETGINAEAGIRYQSKNNRIFADAGVFGMNVSNMLVTKRETEEIFYGANAGKTLHRGIEFNSLIWLYERGRLFPVSLNINYAYIKATFTDYTDDGIDYSGNNLPGIPRENIFLLARVESPWGVSLTPIYQFTDQQFMDDANTQTYDYFQVMHLKLSYEMKIKKAHLDITLGIRNVLNEHYASMILVNAPSFGGAMPRYYYPGMPRNYTISVMLSL
jgi:iron complex outermembrane receptor protein